MGNNRTVHALGRSMADPRCLTDTHFLVMNETNSFSEAKLTEQLVTPEHLSRSYLEACEGSLNAEPLNQELEYLWDDQGASGKSYEIYLGKISRNPVVRSKSTGKYFMLPWSVILKLAADKGINQ